MISVIIPTHKRANLLFYELERIYMQKDVEFEVIVVNDIEEEDETDAIREKFPNVIYIKDNKIQGPSNKHKAGYKIAKGEYLYMPDDDDYLVDEMFFYKATKIMEEKPSVAFVSGQCDILVEHNDTFKNYVKHYQTNILGFVNGIEYLQEFQHKMDKPMSVVPTIFRKLAYDETNAIDMIEMSDSSMYMQALLWGDAYILKDVVAMYRTKANSLTSTAGLKFIMNVLCQKELFYSKAYKRLANPRDFWATHYIATSQLYFNNKNEKKLFHKVLNWGLIHSHGSSRVLVFIIKQYLKLLLK